MLHKQHKAAQSNIKTTQVKYLMDIASLKVKSDYEFKLSNFEGPLDLLLHLIKDAKIDIKDIFLSQVTDQYLSYMQQLDTIDMEKASDFLDVAATLLEIKSGALLPKLEEVMPDEDDPKQRFIRLLEEYNMLQAAAHNLKPFETVGRYYREPGPGAGDERIVLTDFNLDGLLEAFSRLLAKVDMSRRAQDSPREIRRDRFTLPQQISLLRSALTDHERLNFTELFDDQSTRGEVITTFQALLELLKEQFAGASQGEIYGEIEIYLKKEEELHG